MSTPQTFATPAAFRAWLKANHKVAEEIWLRLAKKDSGQTSLSYAQALDEALCFGWIDAQKKGLDDTWWLQRFCPRRPGSKWSKVNVQHVARLTAAKRMQPAGRKAFEETQQDGRVSAAYDSPKNAEPPPDFLKALAKNKAAKAFFATLSRANVYAIVYRLQTAKKPETRARRMDQIVAMLERGEAFH